jgi:hypothetical protein
MKADSATNGENIDRAVLCPPKDESLNRELVLEEYDGMEDILAEVLSGDTVSDHEDDDSLDPKPSSIAENQKQGGSVTSLKSSEGAS